MARRRCVNCSEPIRFAKSTLSGHPIPVDISPDEDRGTIRMHRSGSADGRTEYLAEPLRDSALFTAQASGELLWIDHRTHCSGARETNPMPQDVRALRDALPAPHSRRRRP